MQARLTDFRELTAREITGFDCSSLGTHYEIVLRCMPQNFSNEKSILVQVMAWCRQTPSHYLSQCWPISVWSYGITWHNELINTHSSFAGDAPHWHVLYVRARARQQCERNTDWSTLWQRLTGMLFRITGWKKASRLCIAGFLWGESNYQWIPLTKSHTQPVMWILSSCMVFF